MRVRVYSALRKQRKLPKPEHASPILTGQHLRLFPRQMLEARTKTLFRRVFGVKIVRGIQPVLPISGVFGQTSRA